MDRPLSPSFVQGSGKVDRRRNFGNTRCLYSVTGNVLFRPGRVSMVFKGVRSVAALCQLLQRATQGELISIRVSMLVMTIQLHRTFSVRERCPLELALLHVCGRDAIQMLPRTEEESNALIFRIKDWTTFLPGEPELATTMNSLGSIVSMSRLGNCTMRSSSAARGDVALWIDTQKGVHRALSRFANFVVELDLDLPRSGSVKEERSDPASVNEERPSPANETEERSGPAQRRGWGRSGAMKEEQM
jgi:hypothetical protein